MFGLCLLIDEAYVWTMLDVECVGLCWMLNVLDLMYVRMLNECVCRCGHVLCECVERRHVSCFQLLRGPPSQLTRKKGCHHPHPPCYDQPLLDPR